MKMLFLVDGDNNVGTGLNGIQLLSEDDTVLIFHSRGMQLNRLKARTAQCKANVQFVESVKDGKNSVDFQIVAELGVRAGRGEVEFAYIISQDQGYVAPIESLKQRYPLLFHEVRLAKSIEDCLNLIFVLRAATVSELASAFAHEFGSAQGELIFRHLERLFAREPAAVSFEENENARTENRAPDSGIATPVAEKPSEAVKPQFAEAAPTAPAEHKEVIYPFRSAQQKKAEAAVKAEIKPQIAEAAEAPQETQPEIDDGVKPEIEEKTAAETVIPSTTEQKAAAEVKPRAVTVVLDAPIIPGAAESSTSFHAAFRTPVSEKTVNGSVRTPEQPRESAESKTDKPEMKVKTETAKSRPAARRKKPITAEKTEKQTTSAPIKTTQKKNTAANTAAKENKPVQTVKNPVGRPRRNPANTDKSTSVEEKPETVKETPEKNLETEKNVPAQPAKASAPATAQSAKTVPATSKNHTMKLFAEQFEKIKAGTKQIEVRCNDTKRQKIHVGDTIQFIKQSDDGETMYVHVTGMYVASSFAELYTKFPPEAFGCAGQTPEEMLSATYKVFDKRKEKHYGTVGIGVRPLTAEESKAIGTVSQNK